MTMGARITNSSKLFDFFCLDNAHLDPQIYTMKSKQTRMYSVMSEQVGWNQESKSPVFMKIIFMGVFV